MQTIWKLEEAGGFLIRDAKPRRKPQWFQVWAGLVFGPFRSLEEFAEGALLDECQAVILTAGVPVETKEVSV